MVLLALGLDGHVEISVPAISSLISPCLFLLLSSPLRSKSLTFASSLCADSLYLVTDYEQRVDVHPHDLLYPTDPLLSYFELPTVVSK